MIELIKGLRHIEGLAGNFYLGASTYFKSDKDLSKTLRNFAEDEASHYHHLSSAERFLEENGIVIEADVTLDSETKNKIEKPFKDNLKLLEKNQLTESELIRCIGITELAEWNSLFLYVVNTLKSHNKLFQFIAQRVQGHRKRVESFLLNFDEGKTLIDKIKKSPDVWKNKILIVDDSETIVELLISLLGQEYLVETAKNGEQGLQKIKENYYNLIISDIEMPTMDGLEFFEKASNHEKYLNSRFLFFSSYFNENTMKFIKKNDLDFIRKPADLGVLKTQIRSKISHQEQLSFMHATDQAV